jgi:hypothetical protein
VTALPQERWHDRPGDPGARPWWERPGLEARDGRLEGDIVAILDAGGGDRAMSMTHCLRPLATADCLERRDAPTAKMT